MNYKGKLYGKINNKHFDTGRTSSDFDRMLEALKLLLEAKDLKEKEGNKSINYLAKKGEG